MTEKLTVISSNPNSKGGFVTKLQRKTAVETFVGTKTKSLTYYISGSKQLPLETVVDVDMSQFKVTTHPMLNPSTGESFEGKWLHLA